MVQEEAPPPFRIVSMRYLVLSAAGDDDDAPPPPLWLVSPSRLPAAAIFGFVEINADAEADAEPSNGLVLVVTGAGLLTIGFGNCLA